MLRHLFSYGTLQPHRAPKEISDVVERFEYVGRGEVAGVLFDLGEYPGMVHPKTQSDKVEGTIFQLPDDPDVLRRLDDYEGFNPKDPERSLFVRSRRLVATKDGKQTTCWVYFYNRPVDYAKMSRKRKSG